MDNIQSWSSFEKHQKKRSTDARVSVESVDKTGESTNCGVDALYVSPSSTNISQSAAALLRQAGLSESENDEEFKLKFHWMRPHPSLMFQIEDELQCQKQSGETASGSRPQEMKNSSNDGQRDMNLLHPAVEASRLMKAHRYSQFANNVSAKTNEDTYGERGILSKNQQSLNETEEDQTNSLDLPVELPKLRINLASLVEPPLMSSWLPVEDMENTSTANDI